MSALHAAVGFTGPGLFAGYAASAPELVRIRDSSVDWLSAVDGRSEAAKTCSRLLVEHSVLVALHDMFEALMPTSASEITLPVATELALWLCLNLAWVDAIKPRVARFIPSAMKAVTLSVTDSPEGVTHATVVSAAMWFLRTMAYGPRGFTRGEPRTIVMDMVVSADGREVLAEACSVAESDVNIAAAVISFFNYLARAYANLRRLLDFGTWRLAMDFFRPHDSNTYCDLEDLSAEPEPVDPPTAIQAFLEKKFDSLSRKLSRYAAFNKVPFANRKEVAVIVPVQSFKPATLDRLRDVQDRIRSSLGEHADRGVFNDATKMHITLARVKATEVNAPLIDSVRQRCADLVKEHISARVAARGPLSTVITLTGLRTFEYDDGSSVVYAAPSGDNVELISELRDIVHAKLRHYGLLLDWRSEPSRFVPHCTLLAMEPGHSAPYSDYTDHYFGEVHIDHVAMV